MFPCGLYVMICFVTCCCGKHEQYYTFVFDWFEKNEIINIGIKVFSVTRIIYLLPNLLLLGIGYIIGKTFKIPTLLYFDISKFSARVTGTDAITGSAYKDKMNVMINCLSDRGVVIYGGFILSFLTFCGIGFYCAFGFEFISLIHNGISFFQVLYDIWYWVFMVAVFVVLAAILLASVVILLSNGDIFSGCKNKENTERNTGYNIRNLWEDDGDTTTDKKDAKEAKEATEAENQAILDKKSKILRICAIVYLILVIMTIILSIHIGIVNFVNGVYVFGAIYGGIFIYMVIPQMVYDYYQMENVQDNVPPFFEHMCADIDGEI